MVRGVTFPTIGGLGEEGILSKVGRILTTWTLRSYIYSHMCYNYVMVIHTLKQQVLYYSPVYYIAFVCVIKIPLIACERLKRLSILSSNHQLKADPVQLL